LNGKRRLGNLSSRKKREYRKVFGGKAGSGDLFQRRK